jgi:hypothetical protein
MSAGPELIEYGDDQPVGRRRPSWRVVAVAVVLLLLAGVGYLVNHRTDLAAEGFTRIGSVDGVTLWAKRERRDTQDFVELRSTGALAGLCDRNDRYVRGFISCIGVRPEGGYLVVAIVDNGEHATLVTVEGDPTSASRIQRERPMTVLDAPPHWAHDFAVLADEHDELGRVTAVRLPPG